MSARFLCRVSEDLHLIPVYGSERLARWRGREAWVSLHKDPAPVTRTSQANRYLWSVVYATIAFETGNDPQTIHEALKREAERVGVLERQYVLMGDKLFEDEPTTVVEQEQFSRYVDWLKEGCATGSLIGSVVIIPEPNEVHG